MNYAHQNLSSTTQSPELTTKNTFSFVNSTLVNRVVSEHAFVIPPTKEFTCYASTDALYTASCSVGSSTSTQVTYSTYNKGVVSSHTIQTGEFKSPSNTHHSDRYSGDRITCEHGSNRSNAYTGVFDESNGMNRYADYCDTRYKGACGHNSDWDHTGVGSNIFNERTDSSDVENISNSNPCRNRSNSTQDCRNESNYELRYMSGTSRNFEESQTSNRGEGSNYPAYSYTHEPHSSDSQTHPAYTHDDSIYRRVRFSDSSNQWPYRDQSSQGAPANSCLMMERKPKEPQTYDGTSDFKDYILHFEQVAIWNKWSDIEKAQQLVMCLRGQAQTILPDLTFDQMNKYSEVRAAVERRFDPPGREAAYKRELRDKRLHQSESISQYGYSIRHLVTLAYPEMPRDARDVFATDHFIHGLSSNDMKKHVHFKHPKTLDEAITLAVEYEAFESSIEIPMQTTVLCNAIKRSYKAPDKPSTDRNESILALANVITEGFQKLAELICKMQKRPPFRHRYKPCRKCGKKGHPHYKCPNEQHGQGEETI